MVVIFPDGETRNLPALEHGPMILGLRNASGRPEAIEITLQEIIDAHTYTGEGTVRKYFYTSILPCLGIDGTVRLK